MPRLTCTPDNYSAIAQNPLLASSLRLARAVNAIRAVRDANVPSRALGEDHRVRQSRNLLLFLGAALYEGLLVLDSVGPELGALQSFKENLLPYRKAPEWRELRDTVLKPIRHKVTFHVDPDILPTALANLQFPSYSFATCDPAAKDEPYYELADEALVPALFHQGKYSTVQENLARYINDVVVFAGYFCRSADIVLYDVGARLGFSWGETPEQAT